MAAVTITTDIGRLQTDQIATNQTSQASGFELALLQSGAISGGSDVTEGTTTSWSEVSASGGQRTKRECCLSA